MAERKKQGGKNRRDSHGVYERREARGKGRYTDDSRDSRNSRVDRGRSAGAPKGKSGRDAYQPNNGRNTGVKKNDNYGNRSNGYRNDRKPAERYDGYSDRFEDTPRQELLVGRNPVIEALRAGRDIERIFMAEGAGGSISVIRALAKEHGVSISMVDKAKLNAMALGEKHQSVIAEIPAYHYSEMADIFAKADRAKEQPFIVILDEITDPHNVGAIIRTAECMGAHGVIIPNRRACGLTSTVAKSSAGAIEQIPVVRVTNIARTIEELQAEGIWVAACDMDGAPYYESSSLNGAIAIVIGNEGRGIGKLVKEKCDFTVSIPMKGKINSLNASNAAAVILCEIRRRREE